MSIKNVETHIFNPWSVSWATQSYISSRAMNCVVPNISYHLNRIE